MGTLVRMQSPFRSTCRFQVNRQDFQRIMTERILGPKGGDEIQSDQRKYFKQLAGIQQTRGDLIELLDAGAQHAKLESDLARTNHARWIGEALCDWCVACDAVDTP